MPDSQRKAVAAHRRRQKREGIVRLEVAVRKEDAPLVRSVTKALADPKQAAETRALLRARFASKKRQGLKALLASAPLEGIDLERPRDPGRAIDL